jgi:hypothetical protein
MEAEREFGFRHFDARQEEAEDNSLCFYVFLAASLGFAQTPFDEHDFNSALPEHPGQLRWSAPGSPSLRHRRSRPDGKSVCAVRMLPQKSAFSAFFSFFRKRAPLTSVKCRDGAIKSVCAVRMLPKKSAFSAFFSFSGRGPAHQRQMQRRAIKMDVKDDRTMKVSAQWEISRADGLPIAMSSFQGQEGGRTLYNDPAETSPFTPILR